MRRDWMICESRNRSRRLGNPVSCSLRSRSVCCGWSADRALTPSDHDGRAARHRAGVLCGDVGVARPGGRKMTMRAQVRPALVTVRAADAADRAGLPAAGDRDRAGRASRPGQRQPGHGNRRRAGRLQPDRPELHRSAVLLGPAVGHRGRALHALRRQGADRVERLEPGPAVGRPAARRSRSGSPRCRPPTRATTRPSRPTW